MRREVVRYLGCRPGGVYLDGTLGGGGHALEILDASAPDGRVIGLDCDRDAVDYSIRRLTSYKDRVTIVKENFSNAKGVLRSLGVTCVDGILLDLGVSSHHLDTPERGFSIYHDGPLDMRMEQERNEMSCDFVNGLSESALRDIFRRYGEERWAARISRAIVDKRRVAPIERTSELAEVVSSAIPRRFHKRGVHPATKVFQALRIAVNGELESLRAILDDAMGLLLEGGRMVVISFHSLEDRIVKNSFRFFEGVCTCPQDFPACVCGKREAARLLTRKAILPSVEEVQDNPRARSARLRAVEKL